MKLSDFSDKLKSLGKRAGKKTLVALGAVLVLGCAVAINIILQQNDDMTGGTNLAIDLSKGAGEQTSTLEPNTVKDYFASITLQRKQARDEAMEVLQSVAASSTALDEAKEAALDDINRLALDIEREANIETLVLSKGFEQCVAVISDKSCNIIVKTNGLMPDDVAQISEIVYEQAGILPDNLKIIEKTDLEA